MSGNRNFELLRAKNISRAICVLDALSLSARIVTVGIMSSATGQDAVVHENRAKERERDCVDRCSALDSTGQEEARTTITGASVPVQALGSDSQPLGEKRGPTGSSMSGTGKIESAKPKARLRCCANPLYPALLGIARKQNKDLELLFTILWSINAPPSLRALPRVARNLRRSLLILELRYEIDLAAAGLAEWPEMLKWLASDSDIDQLCYGRKRQFASVLYHCATTHSIYAILWELVGSGLACVRACLALLYIEQAPERVSKEDYERHLREGAGVALRCHNPYEAQHAFHGLLASENVQGLFSSVADTSSLEELQREVLAINVKLNEGAVLLHLPALKGYLTRLASGIPSERITAITSKQRNSSGPKSHQPGSAPTKNKTKIHTVETPRGNVGMTRSTPPMDPEKVRRLLEADTNPSEVRKTEDVWIATPPAPNVDPAVHATVFRAAARAMHKPIELMRSHQRNLSTDEIAILVRHSGEVARMYGLSRAQAPELRRKLLGLAIALCSFFTWSEICDAASVLIFGPDTINGDAPLAIFLAENPSDDHFRARALVPEYTTVGKFDPSIFRPTADYAILPLPPVVSLLIRVLFAKQLQEGFEQPLRLTRNDPGMESAIEQTLKQIDSTGRLTLSRIRESLFSRVVSATKGDLALTSLVFARKHYSVDAEMYYLAYGTREIAKIYLDVANKIHTAAFPDWTLPAVDIDRLVPDADLGCRYYPLIEELVGRITVIRRRGVDAWRKLRKRRKLDPSDPEFAKLHNDLTLYVCLRFAYSTGVRAITSPLPSFDEIIVLRLDDERCVGVVDWSDKDDRAHYHKRELFLDPDELEDLEDYSEYLTKVRKAIPGPKSTNNASCFYIVNGKRILVSPASTAKLFGNVYPYPPNTHRRVLSRELRLAGMSGMSGMSPEIIRAGILGHWAADREPWSALSGLSLPMIRDAILRYVPPIVTRIGFAESLEKAVRHE